MFDLPKSTEIRVNIYKKTIYEKFSKELSGSKRESFDNDIRKITIIHEISENSVNIKATDEVSAIFVILIDLKNKEFNPSNISLISGLFGQKILFVLNYENEYRLAIYETKLLLGDYKCENGISLKIQGLDLSSVWENFVTEVSGIEIEEGNTLSEQIDIEFKKEKLKQKIESAEKKLQREIQSKKKFELFQQIKTYEKELEEM